MVVEIETRKFYQGGVEYEFKWVENRHHLPDIAKNFGNKLIKYYNLVCSNVYPEKIFNSKEILRCSSFKLKNLDKDGLKKISLELLKNNYVTIVDDKNTHKNVSKSIVNLLKMTKIWYDIFYYQMKKPPKHGPILNKILELNKNSLSIEIPIWSTTPEAIIKNLIQKTKFSCMAGELFTGHIDLLLYDEVDNSIIVADYKPENHFLRSLPQVATYGLFIKKMLKLDKIKCISFSKDKLWLYNPEIIRDQIPYYIERFGNPNLIWRYLVKTI